MINELLKKEMNTVIDKHKCTLCGACLNVCSVGAISFNEDKDGFNYPVIDSSKCTNCGLCKKKCPVEHNQQITQKLAVPVCYGGYIKDEEVRLQSSSGGVFSALANYVLDKNGYVCGAKFTKGGTLEHVLIDKKEELDPLRGSKYVQSHVGNCYRKIEQLLKQEKYVLFTGTPCQVAGLYQVLGRDYEKLITVDILCLGTPSQKLFKAFLNEITNGQEEEVENIKFRDKTNGWRNATFSYTLDEKEYKQAYYETSYGIAFGQGMAQRHSCSDCKYVNKERQGDFTIGDFWGFEHSIKKMNDEKGLSAILVNTKKAVSVLSDIKQDFKIIKEVKYFDIANYNRIGRKSHYLHPNKTFFLNELEKKNFKNIENIVKETLSKDDGILLLNYHYSKMNYGSVLTAYALQEKLRKLGYDPHNLKLRNTQKDPSLSNLEEFQQKYIKESPDCETEDEIKALNKYYKTFIVGPDIVWQNYCMHKDFYNHFFNFAKFSKNICSYAASFGANCIFGWNKDSEGNVISVEEDIALRKKYLKRFSHISVREKSGVDMCKNMFDVPATHVLDSVFLLTKNDWKKLIDTAACEVNENTIAKYIINYKKLPKELLDRVDSMENICHLYEGSTFEDLYFDYDNFKCKGPNLEDWIKIISECKLLVTDSFHGMCFAIIFNKDFIITAPQASERHKSLMEMLKIDNRMATSKDEFEALLDKHIDYSKVNKILEEKIKLSEKFLDKILASHNTEPSEARKIAQYFEEQEQCIKTIKNKKEKYYFIGIPVLTRKKSQNSYNIKILGLPIFSLKNMLNGFKIKILAIPFISQKACNGGICLKILGIPFVTTSQKGNKTYYKLFGILKLLKKKVQ